MADWSAEVKKMMTLMRTVFNQEQKEKYLSTVMEQVSAAAGQGAIKEAEKVRRTGIKRTAKRKRRGCSEKTICRLVR